jgi:SAM-dependent methyltransferase
MLTKVRSLFQPGGHAATGVLSSPAPLRHAAAAGPGTLRHSNGLREFLNGWDKVEGRRVLDLGCTSSANLNYFTQLGHNIHSDDLLYEASQPVYLRPPADDPAAPAVFDADAWLADNLEFPAQRFEAILLWDLVDYMPEPLVRPLFERLSEILKPGGTILSYFHTKDAGPEAPFFRYHIHDRETLEMRTGPAHRLQRVFNNRHIENLFRGFRSVKFFLARDNLREVLATK